MRSLDEIAALAREGGPRLLVIVLSTEADLVLAVGKAVQLEMIRPLFIGGSAEIDSLQLELGLSFEADRIELRDERAAMSAAAEALGETGIAAVRNLRAAATLSRELDRRRGSHRPPPLTFVQLFQPEGWERPLLVASPLTAPSDEPAAVLPPARTAVAVAHRVGAELPRVGFLSASALSEPDAREREAAELLFQAARTEGDWLMEGATSLVEALGFDAGGRPDPEARPSERVDLLLTAWPDLSLAIRDTLACFARCRFASVVSGGGRPVVASARADSFDTRFNSIALASVIA